MNCYATNFADMADLRRFKACKAGGGSDEQCFKVGDNGEGCWGDVTAQDHTPMCALPPEDIRAHCGSLHAKEARHRKVLVVMDGGLKCECLLADEMPEHKYRTPGVGIDLNPAAILKLRERTPLKRLCQWFWLS